MRVVTINSLRISSLYANISYSTVAQRPFIASSFQRINVASHIQYTSIRYYRRLSSERYTRRPQPALRPRVLPPNYDAPPPSSTSRSPSSYRNQLVPPAVGQNPAQVKLGLENVLEHPILVVARQLELLNVLVGYEQANKYVIKNSQGVDVGFLAEEETAFSGIIMRQLLRTRRPFQAVVLDAGGNIVLKVKRPIKWFLNSKMFIYDVNDNLIGEVRQVWHLWRRKYDVFLQKMQIAHIDTQFWGWDFFFQDEAGSIFAAIHRQFGGFAREIFTDTGEYFIRMDGMDGQSQRDLTIDERSVILGTAINIDFDYFSRHSGSHGGIGISFPFFSSDHDDDRSNTSSLPTESSSPQQSPTPSSSSTPGMPMPIPIIIPGAFGGAAPKSGSGDTPETSQSAPQSTIPQPSSTVNGSQPPQYPFTQHQQEQQHPVNQWGDEAASPDDSPFLSDEEVFGRNDGDNGDWDDGDDW